MADFDTLWKNFPRDDAIKTRCEEGKGVPFKDYCAIRLSECFQVAGVPMNRFAGAKCWSHRGLKHAIRAQDFADFLIKTPPSGFGKPVKVDPLEFKTVLADKTGIIFFKDYWQRGSGAKKETFQNRSGDHIDLWNKGEITSSGMFMRSVYELFGVVSELSQAKSVLFWEIK